MHQVSDLAIESRVVEGHVELKLQLCLAGWAFSCIIQSLSYVTWLSYQWILPLSSLNQRHSFCADINQAVILRKSIS